MLQSFRRARSSWFVAGFLGIVMIAFIFTGIDRRSGNVQGDAEWVAEAGGETVTAPEFSDMLSRQLARFRQEQQRPDLDMATFIRSGAFDEILGQMIADRAIAAFGREQGLAVSEAMINREIASSPAFQNVAGKFEDMRLRQWLASEKVTESALRRDIATQLMREQLLPPVAAAARAPEGLAREYAAMLLETRSGHVAAVPAAAMGSGPPPSDAEITEFFKRNVARYTIPERRVLRYALFGRADIAAAAQATDAEIQAAYTANAAAYAPKETRTLSQVVLPARAAAESFAAKVAGGTSFAQAASEAGFSASDTAIGQFGREEFARTFPAAVADAAFGAAEGAVTAPVQSPLGWHVIRVDDITTTQGRPIEAVRDELAQQISDRKAIDALLDLVARIEDAVGDGASFEEVARANGLAVQQTAPITARGAAPGVAGYQMPAEVGSLLGTAFDMVEGSDPVVETVAPNQRFALLTVANIAPAAPPPLAEIRAQVQADFIARRAIERARGVANAILAKVDAGMQLGEAAAQAGVPLPPVIPIEARRVDIARPDADAAPPLRAMFGVPAGKARLVPVSEGNGWFVVRTDEVVPGDVSDAPGLVEATRVQLGQVIGMEYGEQFLRAIERQVGVERNAPTIERLRADLSRGALP